MNNLKIFKNDQFGEIRTVEENGTVLFCGKDIALALGYSDTKKAIVQHCQENGVAIYPLIDSMGREQQAKFINEGNVYRLITHSKLPAAEQFEHWVFDEVLPTIRRNGAYMTDDTLEQALTSPDFLIQLATKLKEEKAKRVELEAKVEQDKPMVLFAQAVETAHNSILIGDLAKDTQAERRPDRTETPVRAVKAGGLSDEGRQFSQYAHTARYGDGAVRSQGEHGQ